jgi:hypothetical protein
MHAEHPGAVRRRATLSALALAAVCATGSSVNAQPLYEQQPAPGDQQQPPGNPPPAPADQQQAPGYPPPGAEYAAPAPYQPPAEYAPASTYGPTTQQPSNYAAPPPTLPDRQRGFLIMPFMGINSFQGKSGEGLTVGVRFGGMLGLRLGNLSGGQSSSYLFSTNAEFTGDWGNMKNPPPGGSAYQVHGDFVFSPLLHLILPASALPNTEVVVGPKFGYWFADHEATAPGTGGLYGTPTTTYSYTYAGFALGLNLGAFYGLGESMAVGALFNFDFRVPGSCTNNSTDSYGASCSAGPSMKVFGFSLAALF